MALSTQNVWWRNSSAPGTFSGLFPRVRAYADPKPLPQAGGVRHRYTRTPPPRHSPGWLGGTLRAGPGPLIDPHGAHAGPGPTPPIPPLGHPTRHPLLVIWLRKRRLAGHPKNVLKNAAPLPAPPFCPNANLPARANTTDRTTIVQKGGLFEVCLKVCRGSVSILFTWEFDMQLSLYGETSCKTD